ncbi:XRE family transcriptional regulator [Komarekiella sp. 'clone 1']|uniref:XRE family transcriptional regulator n=1 Tax=Komarekiella delphini-convector SJRDD-AB1 TaxID=2593771 RepID=A0AA40SVY3_9NOST|nr:nucleoside 2-deoxyribosyltransferase [Komarekiella delphini-convector]MBD6616293.1 XRE family transcriptional regulator [Komarekiella delphini-convector SJRDD-AB1]
MNKVYVSGALTDVVNPSETKALYEKIGLLCEEIGLQAYVPHKQTDPVNNPDISPREVFDQDKYQVSRSDLVIAYLGSLSFGVGMELAYAETNKIPIILLYETGKRISRFPRGIPTVIAEIQFHDHEDALNKLRNILTKWNPEHPEFLLSVRQ